MFNVKIFCVFCSIKEGFLIDILDLVLSPGYKDLADEEYVETREDKSTVDVFFNCGDARLLILKSGGFNTPIDCFLLATVLFSNK